MLDSIHRSVALREWSRAGIYDERPPAHKLVKKSPDKRLEKLLGAFDMFFIEQEEGDIDWVCVLSSVRTPSFSRLLTTTDIQAV